MLISFGLHFNAAIAAVAHPASQAQFQRPAAARRRQVARRLNSESQPNRSLRIPAERWRFSIRGRVQGVGYRAA